MQLEPGTIGTLYVYVNRFLTRIEACYQNFQSQLVFTL